MHPRLHPRVLIAAVSVAAAFGSGAAAAQDPAADRLYREAQRLEAQDQRSALDTYALLVAQFPRDPKAPAALLRTVEIHRDARDAPRTDTALEHLLVEYGRSPEAAAGFLIRGEIAVEVARTRAELEDAREILRRVPLLFGADDYPGLEARAQARLLAGRLERLMGDHDDALATLLTLIEDEPSGPATARARREAAWLLIDRGAWREAVEMLQRAIDEAVPDTAASTGGTAIDPLALGGGPAAAEQRLLALVDRRIVRPVSGEPLFGAARRLGAPGTFASPRRVAAHDDGRLLVLDGDSPTVAVLAPDGRVLARTSVRDADAPWWDGERPTIVAAGRLTQPFGGGSVELDEPGKRDGGLKGIIAAARGILNDRFVVAKGEPGLLRYATRARGASLLAEPRRQIVDVGADVHGLIYALDRSDGRVWRIGVERRPDALPLVEGGWKRPTALAVDPLGWIFVLDRSDRRIDVFDDTGNRVSRIGPVVGAMELRSPTDLAVDGAGRVVIADPKLSQLVVLE